MNDKTSNDLLLNIHSLHTTQLGVDRIRKNLLLETADVIGWCKDLIENPGTVITRKGKNWYAAKDGCIITVNAHSYTIITAHKS